MPQPLSEPSYPFHRVLALFVFTVFTVQLTPTLGLHDVVSSSLLFFSLLVAILASLLYFKQAWPWHKKLHMSAAQQRSGHGSSIAISLILTGYLWDKLGGFGELTAITLWSLGALWQTGILFLAMRSWFFHAHWQLVDMDPNWFMPLAGMLLIPLTSGELLHLELRWFLFSLVVMLWLVLFSLLLYRLFFITQLSPHKELSLLLLSSPPLLAFLTYIELSQIQQLDLMARLLFYSGLFMSILILSRALQWLKIAYSDDWWLLIFPLTLIGFALQSVGGLLQLNLFIQLSQVLWVGVALLLAWLSLKSLSNLYD